MTESKILSWTCLCSCSSSGIYCFSEWAHQRNH